MYRRRRSQERDRDLPVTESRRLLFRKRSRPERLERNNHPHALEIHSEPVSPEGGQVGSETRNEKAWNPSPAARSAGERLQVNRLGSFRWKTPQGDASMGHNDSQGQEDRSVRPSLFEKRNIQQVIGDLKAKAMPKRTMRDGQRDSLQDSRRAPDASPYSFPEVSEGDDDIDAGGNHDAERRNPNSADRHMQLRPTSNGPTFNGPKREADRRRPNSSDRHMNVKANLASWLPKSGRFKASAGVSEGQPSNVTTIRQSPSRLGIPRLQRQSVEASHHDEDTTPPSPVEAVPQEDMRSVRNLGELFNQQKLSFRPLLSQLGMPRDGVRRAKSSDSLYNNYDRHAKTMSDPEVLEEHLTLQTDLMKIDGKVEKVEDKLEGFLKESTTFRDDTTGQLECLTTQMNNVQSEHELMFRNVVDICNENNKTLGHVESNFDYLLSVVDRGRSGQAQKYLKLFLRLLGDGAMEVIFRVVHVSSSVFTHVRRLWYGEYELSRLPGEDL